MYIVPWKRIHRSQLEMTAKLGGVYVQSAICGMHARSLGHDEAVFLNLEGNIAEGPGENIFIVRDGYIKTTPLTSILEGITRDSIMTIAGDKGIQVKEDRFTRDEIYIADEAFFTGTAAEITPIRELDGRTIGKGKPGPVTKSIQKIYFDAVSGKSKNKTYKSWLTYVK